MIDRAEFEELVKEAAANLYDYAALETHPQLFTVFRPPEGYTDSKAAYIRHLFGEAIEYFRPPGKDAQITAPEWRPYLILTQRYIEGVTLQELAARLAISDRQLRRDQRRALAALTARLWEKLFPGQGGFESDDASTDFEIQRETIDLGEILGGIEKVMQGRVAEEGLPLVVQLPPEPLLIETDRVILRQVLISTCNAALQRASGAVTVQAAAAGEQAVVTIDLPAAGQHEADLPLKTVRAWAERIEAQVQVQAAGDGFTIQLRLPLAETRVILMIDDQQPSINMFQRYLSRTPFQVVGITRPEQALEAAHSHRPALILLDVMMPQVDGWELLQSLKLDDELHGVPVIICSAWEEPDMARSLGAARFLKKPVTQKALLDALTEVGLLPGG